MSAGLLSLDHAGAELAARVGNKAATLATLRRAGFEVPPGVVVPTDAFRGASDDLPAAVRETLLSVPDLLGAGPWAVRSSSTAEDDDEASFAGQFESFLNVETDGLAEAVLRCWQSTLSNRVKTYAGERGPGSMAVLIQPMIPAEAAGVAFTADPVSGKHHTVIEAVAGLGERLVSGAANPERWIVASSGVIDPPAEKTVLTTEQARAIGDLADRVEKHQGSPQDIEWAIADGLLWLLQARPITTFGPAGTGQIPIPIPIEAPPGYWERDDFHEPVPLSPFGRVLLLEQIIKNFPAACAEFGIMLERIEPAFIGGWIYSRVVPVGAPSPGRGRPHPPPPWLLRTLLRLHPAIRRRAHAALRAIASDLPASVIRRWAEEWRPLFEEETARALSLDLGALSDLDLVAELDRRVWMIGHPAHVMAATAYWILVYQLAETCRVLLGWDTAKTLTLVEGLSTKSTQPARELADLARVARDRPAVLELLAEIDDTTPGRLAEADPDFAQAFSSYLEANGHRILTYDVMTPTLAETPHLLLRLVADQLEISFSPDQAAEEARRTRNQAADEARRILSSHPEADREHFERVLARAREAYPVFEDRVWWTTFVQTALLRYVAIEIAGRLSDRGQLAAAEEVFFLETADARSALLDGTDRRETTRLAKGRRAWAMAHPGPHSYGQPPQGEPPFNLLPDPARLVNNAMMWGLAQLFGERRLPTSDDSIVSGTAASSGRYTGKVRVIMGEHEFTKIQPGDVVVCPVTSPAWSVVFPSMGALVTDMGGILSHPAIIAREHRIPAVVGTGNATVMLNDNQHVVVDGDRGTVTAADQGKREDV
jgi:pyruvate,water dikinase